MALHLKSTGIDFADFSNASGGGDAMTAELMDDYEEGTWTPVYDSPLNLGVNYGAFYTKIGRMYYLPTYHTFSSSSSTSQFLGSNGFSPFTQINNGYTPFIHNRSSGHSSSNIIFGRLNSNATTAYFWTQNEGHQSTTLIREVASGSGHSIMVPIGIQA